jgi:hypothetical protein
MPRAQSTPLSAPVFDEPTVTPDPAKFKVLHPSDTQLYKQVQQLLTKDVVGFSKMSGAPNSLYSLPDALGTKGAAALQAIQSAKRIVFHAGGDSGASAARNLAHELSVADQVTLDCHTAAASDMPRFFYHLGDVVYNFGESQYWYDQFYDPFRNYPAPIFAIPGNHDSFVVPGTKPPDEPLKIFARNFCADKPTITKEAGSLHRTAATQPGVYFTLDAPFVRIIGLFSNALEDPGVISNQSGKFKAVPNFQIEYLTAQLQRVKTEAYQGAVLLATHHPPFSYSPKTNGTGGNHSSSSDMLREIDAICKQVGVYPHAFLSGHAHNYQRYTRTVDFGAKDPYDVPFIVCGDSGHNVNPVVRSQKGQPPAVDPGNGIDVSYLENKPAIKSRGLLLEKHDSLNYGYLRIVVDKNQLRIGFHQAGIATLAQSRFDMVTVDLATHTMVSN